MALISRQQYQQAGQPKASMQASTQPAPQPAQQQATKAPDMSVYNQTSFTPPQGARANDLSGQVPANQLWAQAYNQASNQYGGNTQAQSWTMPGAYSSQSYNPTTGQYGQPTGGQSWDGNMSYQSIDSRPPPISAFATGVNGQAIPWQDALTQREAFVGSLSQRLSEYSGGQRSGPVTFNPSQLLSQADEQLASGSFFNPFSQNQDVRSATGNATQYMQGTFQNPFGNSPQANNPMPSLSQEEYNPGKIDLGNDIYMPVQPPSNPSPNRLPQPAPPKAAPERPQQGSLEQFLEQRGMMDDYRAWTTGRAQPIQPRSQGTQYGSGSKPPMRTSGGGGVVAGSQRIAPVGRSPARRARQV